MEFILYDSQEKGYSQNGTFGYGYIKTTLEENF